VKPDSVPVDYSALDERARLVGDDVKLADIADEALRIRVQRLRLLEWLDEMDRESPISPEEQAAGVELWKRIVSSSTQAPSRPSPKRKVAFVPQSANCSKRARKSSSQPS
jgi:hypothetical protein